MQDPVFIVGADSQIGLALEARLRHDGRAVIGTTRRRPSAGRLHLDLSDPPDRWHLPNRCSVTFLLAGITSLAQCESAPDLTRRVNVAHTLALARAMAARGSHVVFISTNLVLSGAKPDAPASAEIAPQCAYARQKADVEQALLSSEIPASILRITKVAETLSALLSGWAAELVEGRPIAPFTDLVCAPLRCDDVIEALIRLGTTVKTGLFQIGARPDMRYDEIAMRLAEALGVSDDLVRPTSSAQAGVTLLTRPRFTTLQTEATEAQLALPALHSYNAIAGVIAGVSRAISDRKGQGS
jgi:dTDP-4-dehydrorhamnose reductase